MPIRLPRGLARASKYGPSQVMGLWAPYLPPLAVVLHKGRKSGRAYRTPLLAFRKGDKIVIVLMYGETDWLRNVLTAGGGKIVRLGRTWIMTNPRVVDAKDAELTAGVGLTTRVFGEAMIADLKSEPEE